MEIVRLGGELYIPHTHLAHVIVRLILKVRVFLFGANLEIRTSALVLDRKVLFCLIEILLEVFFLLLKDLFFDFFSASVLHLLHGHRCGFLNQH